MIDKLTPEQEAQLAVYRENWIKIGLDTSKTDKKECQKWIKLAYKNANLTPPKKFIWVDSPLEAYNKAKEIGGDETSEYINNFCYGSHDSSRLSFYAYGLEVLKLECCEILRPHMEIAKHCGWWLPFDEVVIVSGKPLSISMKNNMLHNEKGPAIVYRDGFCVYALNGVRVPKDIVETPWDKIDLKILASERNAEIRREIVRKVGIERIIKELHAKIVDKVGDYELISLDFDGRVRPYLKMTNPSIGVYHIEGVPPNTKSVKEALAFRNGTTEEPIMLT